MREWAAKNAAVLAVLAAIFVAYMPLVFNQGVVITDDIFTSDISNGEWPARVEAGRMVRQGSWPVWTRSIYGGTPLVPTSPASEPLTLILFTLLPPVAALNAYILFVLALSGLGTVFLARALGARPAGAAVAGIGFVFSSYIVCQLKHLGIVSCLSWAPFALLCLFRAFDTPLRPSQGERRGHWLGLFSLAYGMQWLAGFAQTAYIATLLYIVWGMSLIIRNRGGRGFLRPTVHFALAGIGGVLIGAVQLAAAYQHTTLSDRSEHVTLEWATHFNYWLPNLWTFLIPYKNGDFGDGTYGMQSIFWEDYSYTGFFTLILAFAALIWFRARFVRFFWVVAVVALLLVLGKYTFVYSIAFYALPGLSFFRFPTRFLFVVQLALALLAAFGLSHFETWLSTRRSAQVAKLAGVLAWLVVGLSFVDLQFFQLRQNPIADADRWMEPPPTAAYLKDRLGDDRVYTHLAERAHRGAAKDAHGWANLEPYYAIRELLQPNANQLWSINAADGYMGLVTREVAFLWGSSLVGTRVGGLGDAAQQKPEMFAQLARVLEVFSVKFIISPVPTALPNGVAVGGAWVYELQQVAPRFRIAARTQRVDTNDAAFLAMRAESFDPVRDVVWVGAADPMPGPISDAEAKAELQSETPVESVVRVTAPHETLLVNGESFHPNWVAEIDGQRTDVFRANINQRAVKVPAGQHMVRFFFDAPSYRVGMMITVLGVLASLVAIWRARRLPR